MANAMLVAINDAEVLAPSTITWSITYILTGADVGGGFTKREVNFNTAVSLTPAQLANAVTAAIQADAVTQGVTVAAGGTLLPSYTTH